MYIHQKIIIVKDAPSSVLTGDIILSEAGICRAFIIISLKIASNTYEMGRFLDIWQSIIQLNSKGRCVEMNRKPEHFGYQKENGTVMKLPRTGEYIIYKDKLYIVTLENEGTYTVVNRGEQLCLNTADVEEEIMLEDTVLAGRHFGDCLILGYYKDLLIIVDSNHNCFSVAV